MGQSVVLVGEKGAGKTTLAKRAIARLSGKKCALVKYIRGKQAISDLAKALGLKLTKPTYNKKGEETGEKKLTQDELETEILLNASSNWIFFIDRADKWAQSLRSWLEDVEDAGVPLVLICTKDKTNGDIYALKTKIEMSQPDIHSVREVMRRHAIAVNHPLTNNEIAKLQQYCGTNLSVAKAIVDQHKAGIKKIRPDQHRQTIIIAPYFWIVLGGVVMLRAYGMGVRNSTFYITGLMATSAVSMSERIGKQITKQKKGLGQ